MGPLSTILPASMKPLTGPDRAKFTIQGHEEKSAREFGKEFGKTMEAYLEALDALVESPDPLESLMDEGSRAVNRCMAVTATISGLPALEAARILVQAASAIEEEAQGDGCLSMLIGESIRQQAEGRSLELEGLATLVEELEDEQAAMAGELEQLRRELGDTEKDPGDRKRRDVH